VVLARGRCLNAVIAEVLVRTGETAHATPAQLNRT
jgi:hypothetical protein